MNGNELNVDGFMAKLSDDSKRQKIESGIARLYPGEHCGKAECMEKISAVFEVASQMGMDIKALMQNCLKNEIMPVCGCMPVPFRDYERHPLKKCRFGFYYGEHPDKTDEQLEAASRRRKEARLEKTLAGRNYDPDAGGDAADYSYDEDTDCDVHEDDGNKLNSLRTELKTLREKSNRTAVDDEQIKKLRTDLANLEARVKAYQVSTFKGFEKERFQKHDELITRLVREFNNNIKEGIGGTDKQAEQVRQKGYLSASLIKAYMIKESGGSPKQWDIDPMTINMGGDRRDKSVDIAKNELGLKKSATFPSGDLETNLRASIRFLARKGFGTSGQAVGKNPDKTFDGWETAVRNYGPNNTSQYPGRGDKHVNRIYEMMGTRINN